MRSALLIGLTIVLLIIGILVIKNMGVDNQAATTKTQAIRHAKQAETAVDKANEKIKDLNKKLSEAR